MDVPAPHEPIFLYGARRLLLVLHAAGSMLLVGASTHHALHMRHYLREKFVRVEQEKRWAKVVSIAYVFTFVIGALLYPTYRYHVRGLYLDRYAPTYSGLFDVKEVYASLTLVVAIGLGALAFVLQPAREKWLVRMYAVMSFLVCGVVWLNVVLGLIVTSVRGIG